MALAGKSANVYITATVPTTAAGEAFSAVGGSSVSHQINTAANRHWTRDPDTAGRPRMLVGGTTAGVPTYDVNYVQGIVTFASTVSGAVTGDVEYLTASSIAEGREWSLTVDRDMFEISTFDSGGWREFQQNVNGAQASVGRYWSTGGLGGGDFFDRINADTDCILEMYPSSTAGDKYEAYAYITADSVAVAVDGIVGEAIDFTIDGALYYTTST